MSSKCPIENWAARPIGCPQRGARTSHRLAASGLETKVREVSVSYIEPEPPRLVSTVDRKSRQSLDIFSSRCTRTKEVMSERWRLKSSPRDQRCSKRKRTWLPDYQNTPSYIRSGGRRVPTTTSLLPARPPSPSSPRRPSQPQSKSRSLRTSVCWLGGGSVGAWALSAPLLYSRNAVATIKIADRLRVIGITPKGLSQ